MLVYWRFCTVIKTREMMMIITETTMVMPYPMTRLFLTFIFLIICVFLLFTSWLSFLIYDHRLRGYTTSPYLPFSTSPKILPSTSVTTRRRMMLTYRLAWVAMITVVPLRLTSCKS